MDEAIIRFVFGSNNFPDGAGRGIVITFKNNGAVIQTSTITMNNWSTYGLTGPGYTKSGVVDLHGFVFHFENFDLGAGGRDHTMYTITKTGI